MSQPLIGAWKLVTDSWHSFTSTWDTTVRYSSWYILVGVLTALYLFLPNVTGMGLVGFIAYIAGMVIAVWSSIRIYQVVFALERKQQVTAKTTQTAFALFWSILLVGILVGLATLGGFILLILPGIYLAIRLGFAQLAVIDNKKKGADALRDSWALTKNRFWPIFGRQLLAGIIFGLLFLVVSGVAIWIVAKLAGTGGYEALAAVEDQSPAIAGINILVNGIVQAAFIPLLSIFQIKLFLSLTKTK
jgi:hypothetical protein